MAVSEKSSNLGLLELANWRAMTAELYAAVRRQAVHDARRAWADFYKERGQMFRSHAQTPLGTEERAAFREISCFPFNPAWRFQAAVSALPQGADVRRYKLGLEEGTLSYRAIAAATFGPVPGGATATLMLYWIDGYGGGLFLPFKDQTNGAETYGGGRYLFDTIKGADLGAGPDTITLDFNFAYNPSCAYSPRWLCPLAPAENSLPFRVEAGELAFNP